VNDSDQYEVMKFLKILNIRLPVATAAERAKAGKANSHQRK
jgi:hypothetical protein